MHDHNTFITLRCDGQHIPVLVFYQCDAVPADGLVHLLVFLFAQRPGQHFGRRHKRFLRFFVQAQMRFQAQDTRERFRHAGLADDAAFVCIQHGIEVLVRVVEEQEHIASGIDGCRQHLAAGHAVRHAHHMGGIRYYHAVEAQLAAQQRGHDLRAQRGGHHVLVLQRGIDGPRVLRQHDMPAHDGIQTAVNKRFIHHPVGLVPLFHAEGVDIVGQMRVAEIQAVAREMLRRTGKARNGVQAVHIRLAHLRHADGVVAESAGHDLGILPVVVDVAHRRESHVAADGRSLLVGHFAKRIGVIVVAGSADLNAGADVGAVRAGAVASGLGVAGNEHRYLGVFLQRAVLLLHGRAGHGVIAAAAQMVFFHQLAQIIFILGGRQLKKQLAYLFLRRHPGDGFLHPAHILVRQAIRFRFQIDHGNLPFFQAKQLLSEARPPPEHSARSTIPRLLLWISILLYHLIAAKR